jgi:hypothetical protein
MIAILLDQVNKMRIPPSQGDFWVTSTVEPHATYRSQLAYIDRVDPERNRDAPNPGLNRRTFSNPV